MSGGEMIDLLDMFGTRLPGAFGFSLGGGSAVAPSHPLYGEIMAALDGRPASLPYPRDQDVLWVTFAPTAEGLRRTIEDLRCWVLPSFGWEARPAVVSGAAGSGQMGALLLAHSPPGYFRWQSRRDETEGVVARLALMRSVIEQAPPRPSQLRPTLEMLRRQFTLALATSDQPLANAAIDEIDQRQLDTAVNTLAMRVRLAAAVGDDHAIVEHPQLDDLLTTRLPRRIVEGVLIAHYNLCLAPLEQAGDISGSLSAYPRLADRLAGLAHMPQEGAEAALVRMAAYDAAAADDAAKLRTLARRFGSDPVVMALAAHVSLSEGRESAGSALAVPAGYFDESAEISDAAQVVEEAHPPEMVLQTLESWADVPSVVAASALDRMSVLLQRAALDPDAFDPGHGDFIIELFTDDAITQDVGKLAAAERVLTAVIDSYVCEERFPRRERLTLYEAILDVWSSIRAESNDPVDGQLHLTMAEALIRLDGKLEPAVAIAIARWWEARPVRSRLAWLGEALELLTDQSTSQQYLALWYDGARLIEADHEGLSLADRYLWNRLGRRLGLDGGTVDEKLGGSWHNLEAGGDPLDGCAYKKVAIVSLHERPAREAAVQIEMRTGASVIVVTDHAAGEGTASAATADVILFVWGATKHAVYRAFDKVRDRLEYVQGTGSASIVRALERRARVSVADPALT